MIDIRDGILLSELMARVAFRLIELDYRRHPEQYGDPVGRMCQLSITLDAEGFPALGMWVASAAYHIERRDMRLVEWRDRTIYRARTHYLNHRNGNGWRRCPDPRVTNRGVRAGSAVVRHPWGYRKARW